MGSHIPEEATPPPSRIELVVARFEEDLRWLKRVPPAIRITVYNKGSSNPLSDSLEGRTQLDVVSLPNVGREAHTYLMHLADRRSVLTPLTVFCQGKPFDHAPDFHDRLEALELGDETPDPFLWYGFLDETDDPLGKRLFVPWSKNPAREELKTGELYTALFGEKSPEWFHFRGGAQFSVSRRAVLKRPAEFYRRLLEHTASDPLAAHALERFWDRIFGEPVIDPSTLSQEGVRYHKKIRRLGNSGTGLFGDSQE
jgi:hypothetical protein